MNINEFMKKNLQLNEKDKKKKIVLIFIASLLAMAAAIYSVFRTRKSDQDSTEKSVGAKKQSKMSKSSVSRKRRAQIVSKRPTAVQSKKEVGETEHEAATAVQQPVAAVQKLVYIVRPLPKEKQESRPHRFKRHMCTAVAVILVISLVGSGAMSYVQPTTVLAQGSFTGIGRIVEDHSNGEPYVILDIVPTVAKYYDFDFSTGTMGYLVDGQAPIVQDIKEYFSNGGTSFYSYDTRMKLIEAVNGGGAGFPSVSYREAYGGVSGIYDVSASSGWIQMLTSVDGVGADTSSTTLPDVPTGLFTGKAEVRKSDATDTAGYNFELIKSDKWTENRLLTDGYYKTNQISGKFQVSFEPSADGNYVIENATKFSALGAAGASSLVYIRVYNGDGSFYYVSTGLTVRDLVQGGEIPKKDGDKSNHEHIFDREWSKNESEHWHECTVEGCSKVSDRGDHDFRDESNETGSWRVCNICGYITDKSDEENQDKNEECEHDWGDDGICKLCGEPKPSDEPKEDPTGSTNPGDDIDEPEIPGNKTDPSDDNTQETETPVDPDLSGGNETPVDPDPSGGDDPTVDPDPSGGNETPAETEEETEEETEKESESEPAGENIINTEIDSARNTTVSGRWMKLAAEGSTEDAPEADFNNAENENHVDEVQNQTEEEHESEDSPNTSGEIDWNNIDWEAFEETEYYVVTFRALEAYEDPLNYDTLYEFMGAEPISSTEGVVDAYDFIEAVEEPKISTLMMELPGVGTLSDAEGQFLYVGEGQGTWKLERVADSSVADGDIGKIAVYNAPVYFQCSSSRYDWLKQYVFSSLSDGDNPNDNFEIEVRTVLASEVTAGDIQGADLVFLESGKNNALLTDSLKTVYIIGSESDGADMNDDAVRAVLQRAAEDFMPVIVDYEIATDENYKDSNYQLLAKAMLKRDLLEFYMAVASNSGLIDNIRNGINDDDYPDKSDGNWNYVNQNVYVINDVLVSQDFPESFDEYTTNAGFSDVLSMIRAENTMLSEGDKIPETVSKARAVQYIINFSVGIIGEIGNLTILELQPTALNTGSDLKTEQDSKGNTKLIWQTENMSTGKQILTSKNSFSINTDIKSVVEFNGEWEDINGVYDFVFIGLDGQRLNLGDDKDRTPQYNNPSLNGKVYHRGDSPYDANDITDQKMTDLLEFMAAGYPVLVENDCFKNGTAQKAVPDDVNTDYIASDTVMYRFLRAALTDEYKDYIYTVSDAMAGSMFMTQMKMARPRINLVPDESGSDSSYKTLAEDANGEYHGRIAYEVTSNKSSDDGYDDYYGDTVVRLYADLNHDGIFAEYEEVTEYTNEGGVIDVEVTGMGPGILPWKLEVSDYGNSNRRDSVQGYFEISSSVNSAKGELNVLQITANKEAGDVNLQTMFYKSTDSLLAYYLSSAESILSTDMQFETVTPAELALHLGENESYLEQWDVVVVTLDGLDLGDTITAINQYVDEGRSLLVCGNAYSGSNRAGLDRVLLGQTDENTFVELGITGNYQRYAGLNDGMYGPVQGVQAERINDGSISYYPYAIGGSSFNIGASVEVKASAYLLDFDGNLKSDGFVTYVTPWYTIGGGSSTAYGISPRDGRNNYYCYSKGNVVYLAQSGYPYTTGSGVGDDECKFFVNALFAAYSAGVHNANVHIVAGFASDSADVESIAVPFDDVWLEADDGSISGTGGILDNTVDVYFRFRDSNIAMNKISKITFLYEDTLGGAELPVGGKTVQAQPFESPIWMVENNRLTLVNGDQLEPGKTYRIQAPVVTLQNDSGTNKADIYIVIETSFTRNGRDYHIISSDSVSLNRAQLFLLE